MADNQLKPIRKQSVSEAVYQQLLQMIKSGEWEDGYRLPSENGLCQMFGVSRVSVRTALHKLEAVGLVEIRNGEGTFVKKADMCSLMEPLLGTLAVSRRDIIDILEFRKLIEEHCVRQFLARRTEQEMKQLARCLEKMQRYAQRGDVSRYSAWDARFHKQIVSGSGNQIIASVYELISESIYAHLCAMNGQIGFDLGMSYHERIYQAIAAGDEETAIACSKRSIDDSIENVRKTMQES